MSNSRRCKLILVTLALASIALSRKTQAQLNPPPDGGYPNGNTAEGTNALFSLTTGAFNTATGNAALYSNTIGNDNTATGFQALRNNATGYDNTANGFKALWSLTTGNSNTALGSKDGELETSTTAEAPSRASASPSPVRVLIPKRGDAGSAS